MSTERKPDGGLEEQIEMLEAFSDMRSDDWSPDSAELLCLLLELRRRREDSQPDDVKRDAMRYRFIRESDFFGADNEPGLASWDDLCDLDCNDFDAAVDARMNHSDSLYPTILLNIEEAK